MDKEEIERMRISPVTVVQLERILNYLSKNEEYSAKLNNLEIRYQDYYEGKEGNIEIFTIYRRREE